MARVYSQLARDRDDISKSTTGIPSEAIQTSAVRSFFRRRFRRQGSEPVVDPTDAKVVFLVGNDATEIQKFHYWATGDDSIKPGNHKISNTKVQWNMCPASRFKPTADPDSSNGNFIFIQVVTTESSNITTWLTNNWRSTPNDVGIIYLKSLPGYDSAFPVERHLLLDFHEACKAANVNIHPLRTVVLSTGWSEENCREMYKKEREWIMGVRKEENGNHPRFGKVILGEQRFARLMDEHKSVIATVNLLFTPDSDSRTRTLAL